MTSLFWYHTNLKKFSSVLISTHFKDNAVQQRRLHRTLPLLDIFILVCQSVKLLRIRNYDLHSRERSSFLVLFNIHPWWGKDTNGSAQSLPQCAKQSNPSTHFSNHQLCRCHYSLANVESPKSWKHFLLQFSCLYTHNKNITSTSTPHYISVTKARII